MKNNFIFTILGATLMLIGLKTFGALDGKSELSTHAIKPVQNMNSIEADKFAANSSEYRATEENHQKLNEHSPVNECPPVNDFTEEQAFEKIAESLFNNPEYNAQIAQMELASLTQQLKRIESIDPIRLKRIQSLAKQKIDDDLKSFNTVYEDSSVFSGLGLFDYQNDSPENESNTELYKKNEAELEEKVASALIKQEQSRVVYEDELRNILSYEELQQYQKNETKLVQSLRLSEIKYTGRILQESVTSLSPQQHSDINQLLSEAKEQALTSIPIGSSIGDEDSMFMLDNVNNFEAETITKMMDLLSPEQFENAPLPYHSFEDLD